MCELSLKEFMTVFEEELAKAGSQEKLGQIAGMTGAAISEIKRGKIAPPPKLLNALGWERRTVYRRKDKQHV